MELNVYFCRKLNSICIFDSKVLPYVNIWALMKIIIRIIHYSRQGRVANYQNEVIFVSDLGGKKYLFVQMF